MDDIMQVPLNMPDGRVLSTHRTAPGHWLLRLESPLEGTRCRRCGREIHDLHGVEAVVRRRHVPLCDVPVFSEVRPKGSRCPYCRGTPTTTHRCAWDEPRRPHTNASEPWALRLLRNAPVVDAARTLGLSEATIEGLLTRGLERAGNGDAWERLGRLGLDAMALTRGPRACVVVVTGPREGGGVESVAVLADRQQETGAAFLRAIPEPLRHPIKRACTDMDAGVVRALAAEGPWAEIVIARFHMARASRACADTVRQQDLTRLKSVRPTAKSAELTGAMWPFRQRPTALKPSAWELLERGFTSSPHMEAASHRREDLTEVCERDDTKGGATCAMRAWCTRGRASGLAACESVLRTIARWLEAIPNDVQGRQTSGFVEGFNHRVTVLTRRGDGIFAVGRLFPRLTRDWHGYQRCGHP